MSDFLKDVGSDSSPDEVLEDQEHEQELEEPTTEPAANTGDDEGADGEGEGQGRTIENVYRELSRKQEAFEQRFLEQQERLIETLAQRGQPEPEKKTGNTLDDMSIEQLNSLRAEVAENNPEKLVEFDAYLNQRRVDEQVTSRMSEWETRQRDEQMRSKAQQDALRRYPELANRGSELYRAVNARLNELGDSYVSANPRAVLDAANDVAAEMGVSPRRAGKAANMRGRVANKGNSNPKAKAEDKDEKPFVSDKEHEKISHRLSGALPKGKKFDKKSLQERGEFYRNNLQYYLRG